MVPEMTRALSDYVDAHGGPDAVSTTPIEGVIVMCSTSERLPFRKIYKPSICIVAQGSKRIDLETESFVYAAGSALVVGIELPGYGAVTQASRAEPFLGLNLEIDVVLLREVLKQMPSPPKPGPDNLGVFVEKLSPQLQDCVVRMVRMFDTPDAVPVLSGTVMKEFYYWLLAGPNGAEISKIARTDSHSHRIADSIYAMRGAVARPMRIEEMAQAAGMSVSSFHQHFKTLTSMSPLQYHKQLRLLEARRLMVAEAANVTDAAFRVGYESPSQFSREYARLFGMAPKRDAMSLKAMNVAV